MSESPIPQPSPSDHEDVSWALSTAEANWRRGDQADALRWLQRAAESASEEGLDVRYLELAKAASELARLIESSPRLPSVPATRAAPSAGTEAHPSATTVQPSPLVLPDRKRPTGPPAQGVRPSVAPRPLPARSAAPVAARPSAPPKKSTSAPPPMAARTSAPPARGPSQAPPARNESKRPDARAPDKAPDNKAEEKRRSRASRPDVKKPTLAALTRPLDPDDLTQVTGPIGSIPPPPTDGEPELDAGDLEPWPTQGSEDVVRAPKRSARPAAPVVDNSPTLVPNAAEARPLQAHYVVLTRTPHGVVVSLSSNKLDAMSIDAMVVALDPNVDLASWLK
ncbi:MAG: hypothetical protein IPG50_01995 [Myxococcales bacterium]|nr:hypothetical protein [Myxococcales bacterium]